MPRQYHPENWSYVWYFTEVLWPQTDMDCVGPDVITAVVMDVAIIWDIAPCSPYMSIRFRGTYRLHLQGRKSAEQETSVLACGGQLGSRVLCI
jgi:hypothetical protein